MITEAVILAAGEGKRLRPLTLKTPKSMLKVKGKPVLYYIIRSLRLNEIKKIVIVVGYKKEVIMDYFGDGSKFGVNIEYAIQEKPGGTGDALLCAKGKVSGKHFIVLNGDVLFDSNILNQMIEKMRGV